MTRLVTVDSGVLAGRRDGAVDAFLGVPYAAPPVGRLRFRRPRPVAPWTGVRAAHEFGPASVQPGSVRARLVLGACGPHDEDCLTLNIWTPADRDLAVMPVLVWIHGGAFTNGSGGVAALRGERLAVATRSVVVTVNYRLGALGFAHHPGLGVDANLGLHDQQAALRWVRANIGAFGGDPGNVTLGGDSAGAMAVGLHSLMPSSRGLFARTVMHGGVPSPGAAGAGVETVEALARELDVAVPELGTVDAHAVVRATAAIAPRHRFGPVAVGELEPALERLHRAAPALPVLVSGAADEGTFFLVDEAAPRVVADREAQELLAALVPDDAAGRYRAATEGLSQDRAGDAHWAFSAAVTAALFDEPTTEWCAAATARHAPVWRSRFRHPASRWDGWLGATHTIDVPVLFGNHHRPELAALFAGDEHVDRISGRLQGWWGSFLHSGRPTRSGAGWPQWTPDAPHVLTVGPSARILP